MPSILRNYQAIWNNRRNLTHIVYVGPQDWAGPLRGRTVFRRWQRLFTVLRLFGGTGRVTLVDHTATKITIKRGDLMVIYMPSSANHLAGIEACRQAGAHVIVDVTADILGLVSRDDAPTAAAMAWQEKVTDEAAAYWRRKDVLHNFCEALERAHCITTSWEYLAQPLAETFPAVPVVHVPDWHRSDETPFMDGLSMATALARGDL